MSNKPVILVTGAGGFVGGRLVEVLSFSKKYRVLGGVRRWSSASRIGRFPVKIELFDLLNKQEVHKALQKADYIVHCAKGAGTINYEGTHNLLECALNCNLKRVVHLSSAVVYGERTGLVNEQNEFKMTSNEYSQTKIEAEKECIHYREKGLDISILRPSIVYGPFSRYFSVLYGKLLATGHWKLDRQIGNGKCNLIFVDDLVRGIICCLENEKAKNETYNINGPEIITWNEYFSMFNGILGKSPILKSSNGVSKIRSIIMQPIRTVGRYAKDNHMVMIKKIASSFEFVDDLLRKVEMEVKSTPDFEDLKLFSRNAIYQTSKIESNLGYKPIYSVEKGLLITTDWLRVNRII